MCRDTVIEMVEAITNEANRNWRLWETGNVYGRRAAFALIAVVITVLPAVGGCKVVSIAEDRTLRERTASGFDAHRYAETIWTARALPYWTERQQPIGAVLTQARRDLPAAGRAHGRRAGDGSPWMFVVDGEGVVEAIEPGRRGRLVLSLPGTPERIGLQSGPVVSGAALRDSLPFIQFDDFANQLAYADVAQALTQKALDQVGPATRALSVGDRVRFQGVAPLLEPADEVVVTPYSLSRVGS